MDIIKYTDEEIAKNFALLEQHLKQTQSGVDEIFCEDCINKHLILLEGLAEEGMNAGGDPGKYQKVHGFVKKIKDKDYQRQGIKFSGEARKIRKSLSTCSTCSLSKDLNNPDTFNDYTHSGRISDYNQLNGEQENMKTELMQLGMMGAGQFAAEGVRYLAETQFPAQEKIVTIGGGAGLMLLPLFIKKIPPFVKTLMMVAGTNLVASGVVKLIRGTPAPVAVARAGVAKANNAGLGGFAGKSFSQTPSFGGPTFAGKVTATNIPSQYARAGILGGAQAFEAPEHADLIRVD